MGKWFPYFYDLSMKPLEAKRFTAIRRKLLQKAKGHVLEIGSGSGVNFPLYQEVQQVDAIEPSREMQKKSASRLEAASVPIYCHQQTAEQLDFADETFDTVVSTLVFCTIPDPEKALKEIQRVAKPGAVFLFFEHVKMEQPLLAKTQDMLTPFWKKICDGCHLNRNTLALIRQAGFQVRETEEFYKGLFITAVCTYDADCL